MTKTQKLQLRASEIRASLNELAGADSPTAEQLADMEKLGKELDGVEVQYRAALRAEPESVVTQTGDVDPETRERLELRARATLTGFIKAAISGKEPTGAELELRQAAGAENIPMELFEPAPDLQLRADTVTGAPSTTGINLDPIRPAVFAASVAPRLNIDMPRVPSGTYATATISTSLSAQTRTKGDAVEAGAAAFTVASATPKRISARLGVTIEDVATVGTANFESSLRENLNLALSDSLDTQILTGNGTAPNLSGIFTRLTDPTDPTNVVTFDDFVAAAASGIEGLWATTMKDVAIVCGPDTYVRSAKTFRDKVIDIANGDEADSARAAASLGDMSFADYAMEKTAGWWTNKRMPAAASDIQQALMCRKGRTGIRTAVCPHWGEVGIDDIYSNSASGQRFLTLHVMVGDVILTQPDAYKQVSFKLA